MQKDVIQLRIKKKETGPRFLYKLRSNTKYTEFLNTLDDRENQNMKKRGTKPTGVLSRKLE